jgi:DNA-binding transcriptional LysR family regulator
MIEDMRHLRAFLAVARVGNFTRAAAELHVSQSALTVQIRQLEESLGVTLFDRGKRRAALTAAGRDVILPLEKILIDTEAVVSRTRELTSLRRGMVTMAVLPSIAAEIVPRAIQKFARSHPGVEVRIRDVVAERVIEAVKKEEVDFGIGSRLRSDTELKSSTLQVGRLSAFIPRSHPLARRDSITLHELLACPLIVTGRDSGVREILQDALKRARLSVTFAFDVNYLSTALGMVKAGLGIAILPDVVAKMDSSGEICCVAIHKPVLTRKVEVIQMKDRSLSPSAVQMVEILRQVTRDPA